MVDNQHFLGIGVTAFVHLAGPGVPASPNTLVNLEMPTVTRLEKQLLHQNFIFHFQFI